jgi:hypothetical protein
VPKKKKYFAQFKVRDFINMMFLTHRGIKSIYITWHTPGEISNYRVEITVRLSHINVCVRLDWYGAVVCTSSIVGNSNQFLQQCTTLIPHLYDVDAYGEDADYDGVTTVRMTALQWDRLMQSTDPKMANLTPIYKHA